jgi:hypothetical protein
MRQIFKNEQLDIQFKELGYIIVDLIDRKTALDLYKTCIQFQSNVNATFYTSLWSSNVEYRKKVDNLILETLKEKVATLFFDYVPFFGDLLVKQPSLNKDFPIHQDWTFVDEEIFTSAYIWCPLQDVNYLNGNLQIVEKSHKFLDKIRGANVTVSYEKIKDKIASKYLKNIKLKAGQAIIFNQALLHASPPNRSLKTRIAMGLLMLPVEAKVFHYYYDEKEAVLKRIEADKLFFMTYSENIDFKEGLKSISYPSTKENTIINLDRTIISFEYFSKTISN